jgi:ABC-type nitrate/sulfonate/bicarbonate transport system substrate-binding protein
VQKNPNTCQALANAIVHGLKWLQTAGPSDIIKTVPEGYLLGDRALYLASFNKVREAISLDGMIPDEGRARRCARWPASTRPSRPTRSTWPRPTPTSSRAGPRIGSRPEIRGCLNSRLS